MGPATDRPIVVVGAGECGGRVAVTLRQQGFTGGVVLIGTEPTLPYERPPLSKAVLTGSAERAPRPSDEAAFAAAGIDVRTASTVTDLDLAAQTLTLDGGETIGYRAAVLATGARPRRLALDPAVDGRIHYLRSESDAFALRDRLAPGVVLVVVGGGFIGLEVAAAAVSRGCRVVVVEAAPRLLGRAVPAPVAAVLDQRHRAAGVDVRLDTSVTGARPAGEGITLDLDDGTSVTADLVVAGIGVVPETEVAEAAGLAVDNGIVVDARLATSDPNVYAAGDCCSFPHPLFGARVRLESWRGPLGQGTPAARLGLGGQDGYAAVPWFWSDQYDLGLQMAGLAIGVELEVLRERRDGGLLWFGLGSADRLSAVAGVGSGTSVAKDVKIAERLIARRVVVEPGVLADPGADLKLLLRG
jgi:3-phenylpropionate/trans-cinnamate dioxygenase ferredoxin reductase subunit